MDEIKAAKEQIRKDMAKAVNGLTERQRTEKTRAIESRLFDFANFLEARIVLLYVDSDCEVRTKSILRRAYAFNKIVVLPGFDGERRKMTILKVDNLDKDLQPGARGVLEPNPERCKPVPLNKVDIAIIPGQAFDEKGGRVGSGRGYYDRFIPELPATTRKVALAFEEQILPLIPTESHDRHVDIIITDKRIIYKI
ncbi:MAG: 5-formyltetrahydrofolate cyclo-ligase [Desulfobacterales bacterium]|nr:5-formyltetrahydrofolate cyclo-ligase [Desulfobacterales bacterium]MCU0586227.1 5-formyltetrahydrofolate cyclo-ligase [Desulfobacterales bacterium]